MNNIQYTIDTLKEVANDIKVDGSTSPIEIFKTYQKCLECYSLLGNEMSSKFSAREKAILGRKMGFAKSFKDSKGTIKERELVSLAKNFGEYQEEIDRGTEFTNYQTLRQSLDRAMSFLSSLQSAIRQVETSQR